MDLTRLKLALMLVAAILFGVSVWLKDDRLRWVAIALLVVAFVLRFVRQGPKDLR